MTIPMRDNHPRPARAPVAPDRGDGSPYDRGDADAYYGRLVRSRPHKMVNGKRVEDLTRDEIAEYYRGAEDNPSGEKDWG